MNQLKYLLGLLLAFSLYACNSWLDVKPKSEQEREEYYSSEDGFKSSLVGCYMKLKSRNLYGEQLTMSNIEFMAQHWVPYSDLQKDFANYNYETIVAEAGLKVWYKGLYETIAQANDLLDYLEKQGSTIKSPERRAVIRGEALAIRAFCHLDILRLFGELPENAVVTRRLPYQEKAANEVVPSYDFAIFGEKLLKDFADAATLLKENDPATRYSFATLNDPVKAVKDGCIQDDFDAFRKIRFNYWAVKALQARANLYLGNKQEAYNCAMEVIDAKVEGKPVAELNCIEDYGNGYYIAPSEILTGFNITNLSDYIPKFFRDESANLLYKTTDENIVLSDIFAGQTSDVRHRSIWTIIRGLKQNQSTVKKYWQTNSGIEGGGDNGLKLDMNRQIVPVIRLAEIYLIAVETAPDLQESNRLMRIFKTSRDLEYTDLHESELAAEILNEYRRELYAEGQMFFTYKRKGTKNILWRSIVMAEENYILPLPKSEMKN